MKIDITSMFFNSKIEGATATAAWGTSVAKQNHPCTIYETPEVTNIISGMLFSSKSDVSNLVIDGMSSGRELVLFSIFDNIYVNGLKVDDASFILLLVREHSNSHEGRILLSYPMYAKYKLEDGRIISNEETKNKIAQRIGCSTSGCWFVSDISIANQDTLLFNAHIVDANNPKIYKGKSQERSEEWKSIVESSTSIKNDLMLKTIEKSSPISVDSENDDFSLDELCLILENWYKDYGPNAIRAFGLRFGELITKRNYSNVEIIRNCPSLKDSKYDAELNKGINLYKAIKEKKFGLSFAEEVLLPGVKDDHFIAKFDIDNPLQQIFYGAPGTGKSHSIEEKTNGKSKIRTTFHPDSDYSTFVGCYKPYKENDNDPITYEFVPQAFVKAYVEAWKKYNEPISSEVYLVIEEINRGNCAQIFGDLFQLLDREKNGFSKYKIDADSDLQRYLQKTFNGDKFDQQFDDIKNGEKLCLPNNLHIWATMNTSDQSLFPMDSAFKRRWEWEYVPVNHEDAKRFHIFIGGKSYNWDDFIVAVNKKVFDATQSADKQLGNRFCKSDGLINSGESDEKKQEYMIFSNQFVSKVMFYLWEEVCKDAPEDEQINFMRLKEKLTSTSSEYFTFQELYEEKTYKDKHLKKEAILQMFMNYLGVAEETSTEFKSLFAETSIADIEESITGRKPTVYDVNDLFATKMSNDSVASSDDDGDGTSNNNEE
ncbi:MAG: AAA family ATPase [Paludibacteraceae bacterium]|nr:AAA family ATPase [Paludibacteraceae bacterium]